MLRAPKLLKINLIQSVGFYDFLGLRDCIFKSVGSSLVLSGERPPELVSRSALAGRFHHKVLEFAATISEKIVLKNKIEEEIKNLQCEVDQWPHLKRTGAVSGWDEINQSASAALRFHRELKSIGHSSQTERVIERTFKTLDGTMVGRPDYFNITGKKIFVREYKSSSLRDLDGRVKSEYEMQGHFYAALLYENFPVEEIEISLESLNGEKVQFSVTRSSAESFKNQVNQEIIRANKEIQNVRAFDELSTPSASACQYCKNKLLCSSFRKEQEGLLISGNTFVLDGIVGDLPTFVNEKFSAVRIIEHHSGVAREINVPTEEAKNMAVHSRYLIENLGNTGSRFQWTDQSRIFLYE